MNHWKLKIWFIRFYRKTLIGRVIEKFIQDRVPNRAAGLSFTTLLALVPIVAVILSFGGYDSIANSLQHLILQTLLPASQEPLLDSLNEFALNSRRLGTWGLLVSLIIIVLLLNAIEKTFNQILRTRPSHNFFFRMSTYISTLILSTLMIGTSITLTGNIPRILAKLSGVENLIPHPIFSGLFSIGLITIALGLMFILLPAGQVPLKSILTGAVFGGIVWEAAKQLFSLWVSNSVRNSVIYGSFFLIPLMFIWIDVGWIIILTGLEITYVHQHGKIPRGSRQGIALPKERIIHSLEMFFYICQNFHQRKKPPRLFELCRFTQLNEESVLSLLDPFIKRKLIYATQGKDGYLPSTSLDRIKLKEVMHVILNGAIRTEPLRNEKGGQIWDKFLQGGYRELQEESIEDLLRKESPLIKDSIQIKLKHSRAE